MPNGRAAPNQTDQDSLPPYDVLDAVLHALVEEEMSVTEIVSRGFSRDTVTRVQRLLYAAEYKRRQAPPGVKITRKSRRDRRYPITNAFAKHSRLVEQRAESTTAPVRIRRPPSWSKDQRSARPANRDRDIRSVAKPEMPDRGVASPVRSRCDNSVVAVR
jgi:hypothetical protein